MPLEVLIHVVGSKLNFLLQVLEYLAHAKRFADQPALLISNRNNELNAYELSMQINLQGD
jgi:hypothetical protein